MKDSPSSVIKGHTPLPWRILAASTVAQTASAYLVATGAFLIPHLSDPQGPYQLSLASAGAVAAAVTGGLMITLVAWGVLVDRIGERTVLLLGSGLGAATMLSPAAIQLTTSTSLTVVALAIALFFGGIAAASANTASGRLIIGWFPMHRRGVAMGVRQMAQPLGVALAAITIPPAAHSAGAITTLLLPAALSVVALLVVATWVRDPARPSRQGTEGIALGSNPYRNKAGLWRIHAAAVLLVVPQFTVWTFALVWLIGELGWSALTAGAFVGATQLAGAGGRVGAGIWSDRVGSRTNPMRIIAICAAIVMAGLAVTDYFGIAIVAVALLVVASVVTVADNGLAYTAAAEIAGPFWGGRVLGIHNTAQNALGTAVPPSIGALIAVAGFPAAFAAAALFAIAAIPAIPRTIDTRE
ncbi:MFS transporter [Hoyosella rhizosphaerae]|uniref:MFS transporter n=1 Tax=Hoyosella rhizosphaerae TaxID=1755582 RepID=A0A916X7L1_9ACTN|nr:MFS transporter [Hoyosella rhizosphaerae]MBN4927336.1 MFS transporter [Hoyosella rhizosphaerae]GGC52064.1 MFS transporter [Hoyosella rhizosphaerae]